MLELLRWRQFHLGYLSSSTWFAVQSQDLLRSCILFKVFKHCVSMHICTYRSVRMYSWKRLTTETRSPVAEDAPRPLNFKAFDQYWPDTAWLTNRTTDRLSENDCIKSCVLRESGEKLDLTLVRVSSYLMGTGGSCVGGKAAGAWSWPLTFM